MTDTETIAAVIVAGIQEATGPLLARVAALEARVQDDALTKELGTLRERVAVVEARPPIPGPEGPPGAPGKDGADGLPGTPGLQYWGVYQDGKAYARGDVVTRGGSAWHCNEPTTTAPGDAAKAWTLMVKRGGDGKPGPMGAKGLDGKDGRDGLDLTQMDAGGRKWR
jgi:hypothetical protein